MAHLSLVELSRCVADGWALFVENAADGESLMLPAGSLGIAGEPLEDANTGYVVGPEGVAEAVRVFVGRLRARGLPGEILAASIVASEANAEAARLGLVQAGTAPLMCCRAAEARRADEGEFEVRRAIDDAGVRDAAEVLADAYDTPADGMERIMGPGFTARDEVAMVVAYDGGRPVSVCGAARMGPSVGLYAVGTRKGDRRRGAGTAAVAGAMDAQIRAGAHLFGLLSEPGAEHFYGDIGFVPVDTVTVWNVPAT